MTSQQCIRKALEISSEIGEARYEEEIYKSKKYRRIQQLIPNRRSYG